MVQKQISLLSFSVKTVWKRWWLNTSHRLFRSFSVFFREMYIVLFLAFLMPVAGSLKGWSFYELILFQSIISMSYAILLLFFSGLRDFKAYTKDRKLDIALLKPEGVLLQILLEDSDWFAAAGHSVLGIGLFIIGVCHCHISLSVEKVIVLLCNLLGAVLIQAALWLFVAALGYFVKKISRLRTILFWLPRDFLRLPMNLYPAVLGTYFVYVTPFAFVSYFPVLELLGKVDEAYPAWFGRISLPIGMGMYLMAYGCWKVGLVWYRKRGR